MLRLSQELYDAASDLADQHNRSLNGEICTSFSKWLYEHDALMLVKDRLLATTTEDTILSILRRTPSFEIGTEVERDTCTCPVRLKEDVGRALRRAHTSFKAGADGFLSLNAFMKMVLAWWISYSFQVSECSKALYNNFMHSNSHPRIALTLPGSVQIREPQCA
tara:strand:+ start:12452 stop:12943 length:492 start_codon:yes stop_codon:yes gene_type:complete